MRILLVWPGHVCATSDVAEGYSKALRTVGHEVFDFEYHNRLAFFNASLNYFEKTNPGFAAQRRPGDWLVLAAEAIAAEAIDANPDVALIVNGMSVHMRAYELLYKMRIPTLTLLTESPYADEVQGLALRNSRVGAALTNDRNSVDYLEEVSGLPVDYLPHSFDPALHFPREVGEEYQSDVFFFGTLWPERKTLFSELKSHQNGYTFYLGGVDPAAKRDQDAATGQPAAPAIVPNSILARYYCGAKIALNHNRTLMGIDPEDVQHPKHLASGAAYSLGPRAYEIAACGAFQLTDARPELHEVFGESVATYAGADDLTGKALYYLEHDDERLEMAEEARQRVQACTFENRAREIVIPALERLLERSN